jgi:hypothetical protein
MTDTNTITPAATSPTPKPAAAKPNGSKPAVKAAAKAKLPQKAKESSNLVSLADLCKEAKVEPKVARVRLRASKLKKSAKHGWAFEKAAQR